MIAYAAVPAELRAKSILARMDSFSAKIKTLEEDIRLLWLDFENLKAGETILGCATKKEFCLKKLNRTPRAVRYMLDGGNTNRPSLTEGETFSPQEQLESIKAQTDDLLKLDVPSTEFEIAKKEINAAWVDYQQTAPVRLRFGQICYEWQQKLKTVELAAVWQELSIPETSALREMDSYLESRGQKRLRIEKRTNREEPDNFEDIRKMALTMLALGYKELQKTDVKCSLLDSAKTWARCTLEEKQK